MWKIWGKKYDLGGELKCVREEKDIEVEHTKNINRKYENAQATVADIEYDQIELQSHIDYLTSDLVVSCKSANEIKKNWTRTSIVKLNLENMYSN